MRAEPTVAALVRARLTHQVPIQLEARAGDALAIVEDGPLPAGGRLFIPGLLPCGECPACRRALCVACTHLRRVVAPPGSQRRVEVPERFVVAVDLDIDKGALPAPTAIAAGLVADVIGAGGRAGLGPGDTAIWIGRQPWARIGASWSVGRGCRTFLLSSAAPAAPAAPSAAAPSRPAPDPRIIALPPGADPLAWGALIADAEAAGGPAGGRPERRIFVCGDEPEQARAAIALATPGSTLSFLLGAPPVIAGLDAAPPLRLLTGSGGHPDLIAESLAAMRRGEIDVEGAFSEVSATAEEEATASFRHAPGPAIPFVAFDDQA